MVWIGWVGWASLIVQLGIVNSPTLYGARVHHHNHMEASSQAPDYYTAWLANQLQLAKFLRFYLCAIILIIDIL